MTVLWTGTSISECYNKRHAVHIFAVGDMVSIGIPKNRTTNY